jgi:phage tail-like protein
MTTDISLAEEERRAPVDTEPSKYLKYLPGLYCEDEFMGRFLKIFENIITPIEQVIDHVQVYFDPDLAPEDLLPWLASWVDLVLDEEWAVEKRRRLIGSAVELYQWRGTRRGLREYLNIYTGVEPEITEHIGGFRLGEQSSLGWSTVLGEGQDHCFTVTLELDDPSAVDLDKVRAIIEAEKPAHAAYNLKVVKRESVEASPAEGESDIQAGSQSD